MAPISGTSLCLMLLSASFAGLIQWNPLIFGRSSASFDDKEQLTAASDNFFVYVAHDVAEEVLVQYAHAIDDAFEIHHQHVMRTLSFAVHYAGGIAKVPTKHVNLLGLALAHAQLPLWEQPQQQQQDDDIDSDTNNKNNNDHPIVRKAIQNLHNEKKAHKYHNHNLDAADWQTMEAIIRHQLQILPYSSSSSLSESSTKANVLLVEAARKAMWTDLTHGLVRFDGLPISYVERAYTELTVSGGLLEWLFRRTPPSTTSNSNSGAGSAAGQSLWKLIRLY